MILKKTILCFFICGSLLFGCKEKQQKTKIETAPIEFTKEAEALLISAEGDTLEQLEIEISDSDYERETGLMYRHKMDINQGMLFVFEQEAPRGFYMKNTYIPLDLIFLNAGKEIVHISENATPESLESIPSRKPAQYVLEINAGLAKKWALEVGDILSLSTAAK